MNDRQIELKEHSAHIFEMGCMERPVYLKEKVLEYWPDYCHNAH